MQDLNDLVALIRRTKFKSAGLMDLVLEPHTQLYQLYQVIARQQVPPSDEEILAALPELGGDETRLATLKSKLKDRLLDAVLLLDYKETAYTDRERAYFEVSRRLAATMTLLYRQARDLAIGQLEGLLRYTVRFEFTELTLSILRVLRLHFGLLEGNQRKYAQYEAQLQEYEDLWLAERQVESLYADLVGRFVNSKAEKEALADKAAVAYVQVKPLRERFSSYTVQLFGRLIESMLHESRNDYVRVADVCECAIQFFNEKEYQSGLSLQLMYYNLVKSCVYLRQWDRGRLYSQRFERLLERGSFNWFRLQELNVLMALHAGEYATAYDLYHDVAEHPRFAALPAPALELWKIYEAYVCYLVLIGQIRTEGADHTQSHFRLHRFINEVHLFAKDKRGMNVSVQIVQFLYYLAEGRYDQCEERVDALNKYRTRYLQHDDTQRSNCFLRMLVQIPGQGFDRARVEEKTVRLQQSLYELPWETVNQSIEIEVVPYEALWSFALNSLKQVRVLNTTSYRPQ